MRWLQLVVVFCLASTLGLPAAWAVTLNEIRVDQTGTDNDEYVELIGTAGESLSGVTLVVIGDGTVGSGVIEAVVNFSGVVGTSGYFLAAESTFTLGVTVDQTTNLNFENDDNVTFILVTGFTGTLLQDIDINDDGTFEVTPWATELDRIALVGEGTDIAYGPPSVGPDSGTTGSPFHVIRCGSGFVLSAQTIGVEDTPGADNTCPACGDGFVYTGEICDGDGAGMPGETATCDSDCTTATCGDGTLNMTATEQCDDGGESATCDPDCTTASCGDATVNMTAGEQCDDAGETATCDVDCTTVMCGDGTTNMTALEDCDTMGESATCDADCTNVSCGDMTVNTTAGETCDDGMRTATCDANCTAVSCGDGTLNMAAGEQCDGDGAGTPGETATCDLDCTTAMCGDMNVNMTASEACDDGAATATCDVDCTPAECGDNTINMVAGEECDDGNVAGGDGCDATCQDEGAGGAGGAGGSGTGATGGSASVGGNATGPSSTSSGIDAGPDGQSEDEGGCGCRVPGSGDDSDRILLVGLLGLLLLARRRSRNG